MFLLADHHATQAEYAERLQRAEHERFARRVHTHQHRTHLTTGAALLWLGHRLSSWGQSLQQRHAYAALAQHEDMRTSS